MKEGMKNQMNENQENNENKINSSIHFQVQTYGCKVNTYDTGLIEKSFREAGYVVRSSGSSPETFPESLHERHKVQNKVHIINTCAVTAEATREALTKARQVKKRNPDTLVVVTGCGAQVDTEKFSLSPEVDLVVANSHKGELATLVEKLTRGDLENRVYKSNIFKKEDFESGGGYESRHTRSFLKIQDGCNSFCSYCVIPFARGKSRSLSVDEIVERVQKLEREGVAEVVLVGIHLGDYQDLNYSSQKGPALVVREILKRTQIPRLRLSSLEPPELTEELLDLFTEERVCSHFHMSIQSATDRTLQAMKRHYSVLDVEQSLEQIKSVLPQAFVGMDVIVGFPGESDEDFNETYKRLSDLPWTKIHVFPYSERPGTRAAQITTAVPQGIIRERALRLRQLSSDRYKTMLINQVGSVKEVLVLSYKSHPNPSPSSIPSLNLNLNLNPNSRSSRTCHWVQGLSRDYWPVYWQEDTNGTNHSLPGNEIRVKIKGFQGSEGFEQNALVPSEGVLWAQPLPY